MKVAQNTSYPSLSGKHVLVTGGADGIGASLVRAFVGQGAIVTFLDINDAAAQALVNSTAADSGAHAPMFIHCDLADSAALKAAVHEALTHSGPIGVLINNAANDDRHQWKEVTPEYWDERMAVNLKHQFFALQAVAKSMGAAGGGSIINMGSAAWRLGSPGMPCYVAAKAAISGLTRAMARELGDQGIRVNSIVPGWIMTPRQLRLWFKPSDEGALLSRQCVKRLLQPDDIAKMALFLASDDSAACSGQEFVVDGGLI